MSIPSSIIVTNKKRWIINGCCIYKTKMCFDHLNKGMCKRTDCIFAHSSQELLQKNHNCETTHHNITHMEKNIIMFNLYTKKIEDQQYRIVNQEETIKCKNYIIDQQHNNIEHLQLVVEEQSANSQQIIKQEAEIENYKNIIIRQQNLVVRTIDNQKKLQNIQNRLQETIALQTKRIADLEIVNIHL